MLGGSLRSPGCREESLPFKNPGAAYFQGWFCLFFRVFLLCLYGGESFCLEKSERGKKEMKENKEKVREGERKKKGRFHFVILSFFRLFELGLREGGTLENPGGEK